MCDRYMLPPKRVICCHFIDTGGKFWQSSRRHLNGGIAEEAFVRIVHLGPAFGDFNII